MSDRIFGGIGLLFALLFIWAAFHIELSFISDPVGPRTFPIILAVVMAVASLVIIIKPDVRPQWPRASRLLEIAIAAGVMVAYALALPEVGFLIATAVASAFLTWRLGTQPLWSLVSGTLTSIGIYTVFHLILGLSLARGPFGF
ncbi:tripartite tricarboxylate transporter TctB family protein [Granulosicoccus sp. 3-233]|uniref:tripartite tricarboxylate transporter TctB family protein n=1 Tax=Granulosicoccus sp. 3-233 TaxID=3417969 RepID=UPI003D34E608